MPADALPQPRPLPLPRARFRHEYRDALGRPMKGSVTFTGKTGTRLDGVSVPPTSIRVDIDGGVIEVDLLPDRYTFVASLRTLDGAQHTDRGEVDLSD